MKNLTDITIILDRSGSMISIKKPTIKAFNTFIKDQKKDDLPTKLSLIQFDDQYEVNFTNKDIHLVKKLNSDTFQPRGFTALLDAIGTTIRSTKKRIKSSDMKPENVIIAIITDGYENASRRYDREKIFKMIRKREDKDNWNFVFLAANQDAIKEGANMGINADRALTYHADAEGVEEAVKSFSTQIHCLRSEPGLTFKFSDNDRIKQERNPKTEISSDEYDESVKQIEKEIQDLFKNYKN